MQGTMESTLSWFSYPKSEVSAHYGIAKDGRIWQFVDPHNTAWANGIVSEPDTSIKWLAVAVRDGVNPNYLTISIEHEGNSGEPMPETQYLSSLALHRSLVKAYALNPDSQHIIRHSQIDSINRLVCPGPSFPMERLLKELNQVDKSFTDPVTGFQVQEPFASFYLLNGGLTVFGRPLRNEEPVMWYYGAANLIQWFERARFELQPDGSIWLGLVGKEALKALLHPVNLSSTT